MKKKKEMQEQTKQQIMDFVNKLPTYQHILENEPNEAELLAIRLFVNSYFKVRHSIDTMGVATVFERYRSGQIPLNDVIKFGSLLSSLLDYEQILDCKKQINLDIENHRETVSALEEYEYDMVYYILKSIFDVSIKNNNK